MTIYLQHVNGDDRDKVETFGSDRVRIGRNPDNDLTFDPEKARQVGRYHAEIYRDRDQYFVKDLQSRNGTFVGGRRIEQPTPITDGDVLQFASGGPTLRFSTRGPSPAGATGATGITMARRAPEATPAPERKPWRRAVLVLGAAAAGALVVAAALGYYWSSWWAFSSGFVGAAAVESMGLYAWTWWRARRERAEARAAAESPSDARPQTDTQRDLAARWAEGVTALRQSNLQQRGEDAVYALPWYLLLGERGAGSSAAVRAARPLPSSAAARRGTGATTTCDWWFFEKCVVLDVTGRYLSQPDQAADGAEWRRFLGLVRRTRRRQPLNGVVVTLTAEGLAARGTERLQEAAGQIRRRLDEMGRELGLAFPVYLLVTHLDTVAGFSRFFGRLPEDALDQAMGAMNENVDGHPDVGAIAEGAVRTIGARLDALRLKILNDVETATLDDASEPFLFVEEFKTLGRPLRAFAEALFRRSPYHETPLFRGIHFASTAQDRASASRLADRMGLETMRVRSEAAARPFFARHLFAQILPAEGGLVRPTSQWYRRYHGAQLAGILGAAAFALALLLVFTLSFVRNSQALGHAVIDGCRPTLGAPAAGAPLPPGRLLQLEDCREAVESLLPGSRWARLSVDFGLNHTEPLALALRDRYVEGARRDVIEPLEARIDRKLAPGPEAPAYVAALLDRVTLLGHCRGGGCPALTDWMSPRYAAMLRADQPGVGEPTIARLARTEAAYLRWQPDAAALDRLRGADAERVTRWIRTGGLRSDWILTSASTRFPAIRMKDFWGTDGSPLIDGAYTARAWSDAVGPLITGLRAIPAEQVETAAALNKFEADYRREALRQWQAFLQAFPQGERLAGGRRGGRDFAVWVVAQGSPYRRLLDAGVVNVVPLAPGASAEAPSWVRTFARYAALRAKLGEVQKLSPEEQKSRLKQNEREAAANLAAYGEAVQQLQAEMAAPEKAYRSALRAFEDGDPSARSTHPVQKALWTVRYLKGLLGEEQGDDTLFWQLLSRPVELAWRAILDEAGIHLQQQWAAIWPELAALETPPAQRASRAIGFVNDKLAGALEPRGDRYVPKTLFNESVQFTGGFLDYLARARLFSPEGSARFEPPRQIVTTF